MQDLISEPGGQLFAKGSFARGHLVEHRPKRPDINAWVRFPSLQLLRRHVGQSAPNLVRLGEAGGGVLFAPQWLYEMCQAEVQDLEPTVGCAPQVARL